jgi:hypothetical protein
MDVKSFLTTVPGIQNAFLIVDSSIVQSSFQQDMTALLMDLSLITEALMERHGAVQKISMSGNRNLFFFYYKNMILGIEGDDSVSLPLMNIRVKILFKKIDEDGMEQVTSSQKEK